MRPIYQYCIVLLLLLSHSVSAEPGVFSASSEDHRVALLELYTSQGCSSCPPAEKWLGQLEEFGLEPAKIVPMALHVDYWDYIGWKDRFAKTEHTQRQRQTGKRNRLNTIYTPQFVLNGRDLRPARKIDQRLAQINQQRASIGISLTASLIGDEAVKVDWQTEPALPDASSLYLVITENNLQTEVNAGENHGRTLDHHHVVRSMARFSRHSPATVSIPLDSKLNLKHLDLLAFVETDDGQILQTLKLPLH